MRKTGLALRRWALLFGMSCIFLYSLAACIIVWDGLTERVFRADAVVVPGNTVNEDGTPSPRLSARLDRALELYRTGMCRLIIVSGGTGGEGFDEAAVMRLYLLDHSVPDRDIIVDSDGYTTWDTARFTAGIAMERDMKSVIAVSQYFHVPRTRLALQRAGMTEVGGAYAWHMEWRDLYSIAREVPAYAVYLVRKEVLAEDIRRE